MTQNILTGAVLIVDDEEDIGEGLATYLHGWVPDARIYVARDGPSALEAMEREPVDVLVADYRMPRMDGLELLERVKARWPRTVRIMMSAYGDRTLILEAVNRAHVHGFAPKPLDPDSVAQQVVEGLLIAARLRLQTRKAEMQDTLVRDAMAALGNLRRLPQEAAARPPGESP